MDRDRDRPMVGAKDHGPTWLKSSSCRGGVQGGGRTMDRDRDRPKVGAKDHGPTWLKSSSCRGGVQGGGRTMDRDRDQCPSGHGRWVSHLVRLVGVYIYTNTVLVQYIYIYIIYSIYNM